MKKLSVLFSLAFFAIFMFVVQSVFAQITETATALATIPVDEAVSQIWGLYLANKGSTLGLIFVAVQGIMLLIKTPLGNLIKFNGWSTKWKMLVVAVLTFVGTALSAWITNGSWQSMLGDMTVLTALQVLFFQIIKIKK